MIRDFTQYGTGAEGAPVHRSANPALLAVAEAMAVDVPTSTFDPVTATGVRAAPEAAAESDAGLYPYRFTVPFSLLNRVSTSPTTAPVTYATWPGETVPCETHFLSR